MFLELILNGICCHAWLFHTSILILPRFVRGQMSSVCVFASVCVCERVYWMCTVFRIKAAD